MMNFLLLLFVLCLGVFFISMYFQLAKIENTLKKHLEQIEYYLVELYGEIGKEDLELEEERTKKSSSGNEIDES